MFHYSELWLVVDQGERNKEVKLDNNKRKASHGTHTFFRMSCKRRFDSQFNKRYTTFLYL